MGFIFFAISTFFLVCCHRVMLWRGRRTLGIFLVYPLGYLAMFPLFTSLHMVALYVVLSALACIVFITPVLGDVAPTSRILSYLREYPDASYRSILHLFRDKDMVGKRLEDLVAVGLVQKRVTRYTASIAGMLVAGVIARYLQLIDWEISG